MGSPKEFPKALAYIRTSSATNVGTDKDSDKRQTAAIEAYAASAGIEIVGTYYDASVSGADPIDSRPGFAEMLERIEGNGVRTIIVETSSRFARDLMVQEIGFSMLQKRGISLIAADSPSAFIDDTPTSILIRQVLGAVSQFEKAMLVAKLKGARDRKSKGRKRIEGRKSLSEVRPETIQLAKKLSRKSPKGGTLSLREISVELFNAGHKTKNNTPYTATAVSKMLK